MVSVSCMPVCHVTLFSIGHSITLLAGVLLKVDVNAYLVDAIIGLSVAYKAFDKRKSGWVKVELRPGK